MSSKTANQTLVEQKLALDLFLESLLREPVAEPEYDDGAPVSVVEAPVIEPEVELAPPPVEEQLESTVAEQTPAEAPGLDTATAQASRQAGEDLPLWANVFQAMLFKVAGLTLAVPLEELSGVVEFDQDELTEMPGHADFYLGIMQYLGKSVPVIDTARIVFPPNKLVQLAGDDPYARVRRVVLINDGRWGLACDSVEEVITLRRHEVKWRSDRTKRRWLLGTVIEYMCALVDTEAFGQRLLQGTD